MEWRLEMKVTPSTVVRLVRHHRDHVRRKALSDARAEKDEGSIPDQG